MRYIRVETYNKDDDVTMGGFISAMDVVLCCALDIEPGYTPEELQKRLKETENDKEVVKMWSIVKTLSEIPHPEEYVKNKSERYCLFHPTKFEEIKTELGYIDKKLQNLTDGSLLLIYKSFDLDKRVIRYEDKDQIVISKAIYCKKDTGKYNTFS